MSINSFAGLSSSGHELIYSDLFLDRSGEIPQFCKIHHYNTKNHPSIEWATTIMTTTVFLNNWSSNCHTITSFGAGLVERDRKDMIRLEFQKFHIVFDSVDSRIMHVHSKDSSYEKLMNANGNNENKICNPDKCKKKMLKYFNFYVCVQM